MGKSAVGEDVLEPRIAQSIRDYIPGTYIQMSEKFRHNYNKSGLELGLTGIIFQIISKDVVGKQYTSDTNLGKQYAEKLKSSTEVWYQSLTDKLLIGSFTFHPEPECADRNPLIVTKQYILEQADRRIEKLNNLKDSLL